MSGTKYSAPTISGGTFTVSVSLSASSGATSGPDGFDGEGDYFTGSASCSAGVGPVTVSTSTPSINPMGVAVGSNGNYYVDGSGNYDILIGQQCKPMLAGIPSGCTVSGYSWTVSGSTFQSWTASTTATTLSTGPGPLNVATPSWYWDDINQTTETITCTATVTPPAGQGSAFTATATQKVTVMVPTLIASGTGGYEQVNTNCPNQNGAICIYAGPTATMTANNQPSGISWKTLVTTPPKPAFGTGQFEIVQLTTPNRSYTTVAAPTQTHTYAPGFGLDTQYPIFVAAEGAGPNTSGDSPWLQLVSNGMSVNTVTIKDQFTDYLMYQPPGSSSNVQWVPLATFGWSTNGNATIPMSGNPPVGNWSIYASQNGSDSAGTVTPNTTVQFTPLTTPLSFPAWTQIDAFGPF